MSLLLPSYCDLNTLKGKTVPMQVAKTAYRRDGVLGPDSCSWHYVEGLTVEDVCELAIVWDKVPGLGHNGQRLAKGSRAVLLLAGNETYVPAAEWEGFLKLLKQQEELLRRRPARWNEVAPKIERTE